MCLELLSLMSAIHYTDANPFINNNKSACTHSATIGDKIEGILPVA